MEYLVFFQNIDGVMCCEILTQEQIESADFIAKEHIEFQVEKTEGLAAIFSAIATRI